MKLFLTFACLFLAVTASFGVQKTEPVVSVAQGRLKGAVRQLLDGTPYFSFKGVPYAQPPVGELRFAAPLPPKPWNGTLEAVKHGPICPQFDETTGNTMEGDENCLFLNVYTKSLNNDAKIPVMVFIHGGGYLSGNGNAEEGFGPEFLLQHNVILVTLNYRLEVLGFLCLDTPEVPGNAGMRDQVMALRWIKNNIAKFAGDPEKVTIFGESSGSSSVTYHLHSPMSKHLFSKAIAQSGVSLNDNSQGKDGKQRAFRVGKVLGKETNDTKELLDFLRSVSVVKLVGLTMQTRTTDEQLRDMTTFVPVVEKKFDNVEAFLSEEPIDMLLAKNMNDAPLMLGHTSEEMLGSVNYLLDRLNLTNANIQLLVPREIAERLSEDKVKELGSRIRIFYVGNKEFTRDDAEKMVNLFSDQFTYNIHRFANLYATIQRSTYLYIFSFETDLNIVKNQSGMSGMKGASHADDLYYLFYSDSNKAPYEGQPKLREIVFRVTKLWTDFATIGNPTPDKSLEEKWTPYTPSTRNFLDMNETMSIGHDTDQDTVQFWDKLYCEAGLSCIST